MRAYQSTHAELFFSGILYGEIHLEYDQRGHLLLSCSTSIESFPLMVQCHRMIRGYVIQTPNDFKVIHENELLFSFFLCSLSPKYLLLAIHAVN